MLQVHMRGTQRTDGSWKMYFCVLDSLDRARWCNERYFDIPHNISALKLLQCEWAKFRLYLRLGRGQHAVVVSAEFIQKNGIVFKPAKQLLLRSFPS